MIDAKRTVGEIAALTHQRFRCSNDWASDTAATERKLSKTHVEPYRFLWTMFSRNSTTP